MSRKAPKNVQATVQQGSVVLEWELDDFFPDPETPDRVIIEIGQSEPLLTVPGNELSVELEARLFEPFVNRVVVINVAFQWDKDPPLPSSTNVFIPGPGDGPLSPPPVPNQHAPSAATSLRVSLQTQAFGFLAIVRWENPVDYDKILVRWGPKNLEPVQFEIGNAVTTADAVPIRGGLTYTFAVKGGLSITFGGFNYSAWSFFEVEAPEAPWRRSTPGFGHELAALDASPTSWYTTPENVQHIAYVGVDRQIHELFFRIGGNGGWMHSVPGAGHAKVAPGSSPTSWYTTPENVQHFAYIGEDLQIHQCYFFVGGFGGWRDEITSAGRPRVAPNTSPTSWYSTPENIEHIAYIGNDQVVQELFFGVS